MKKPRRFRLGHRTQHVLHNGEHLLHIGYCTAVFVESHYIYGYLAGVLGFVLVIMYFTETGE